MNKQKLTIEDTSEMVLEIINNTGKAIICLPLLIIVLPVMGLVGSISWIIVTIANMRK